MLTQTELAQFVDKARELMNDSGAHWGKQFFKHRDRYCAIGAVRQVLFGTTSIDTPIEDTRYRAVVNALAQAILEEHQAGRYTGELIGSTGPVYSMFDTDNIYAFNDHPNTEWPDVERVFERAAEILNS